MSDDAAAATDSAFDIASRSQFTRCGSGHQSIAVVMARCCAVGDKGRQKGRPVRQLGWENGASGSSARQ
jgi:hypothetical protein